ncbi:MAG: ABC transporter substrate-binding protein [Rhodobacteraceae bacterium]|nr:ABC transporter substrate-binding protein [Paracoccaceae bacterium]
MTSLRALTLTLALALALPVAGAGAGAGADSQGGGGAPGRVVSVNLCTDQLAMLLAAPGQLVSVSHVARDPLVSAMAEEARALPVNHGRAEEVHALRPDLVLAMTWSSPVMLSMLERLGIAVLRMPPASDFEGIRANIATLGTALGREGEAQALIARFDAGLDALRRPSETTPLRAAVLSANSFTSGAGSLAARLLEAAGMVNIASEMGLSGGGHLPLERLVMAAPDVILLAETYRGASRAEEILAHPALAVLPGVARRATMEGADWTCGTPHVLRAIAALAALAALHDDRAP